MKRLIALFFALGCAAFADINAVNGVTASTTSNINGVTNPSAVNGQTLVSGGAFNPQTQGTLVNWYDASVLGLANGASVASFTDSKTGAPNTMALTAGTVTYATAQQNGLATANVAGDYRNGGSTASTFPYTIAAVVRIANNSNNRTILGPSNTGGLQFRIDITTGNLTLNKSNVANIGTSTSAVGTGAYHLVVCTVDSSNYAFYIDGVAAGSGSHAQTLTAALTFRLFINITAEGFTGHVGEIQIYNSVLSGGDLTGLHTYIVNKWATP